MTTSDLVDVLAKDRNLSEAETRRLMDTITKTLKEKLAEGTSFSIPELGTFDTKTREERESYNPHYEQYMKLPPKRVVEFSASETLKEDLKDLESDNE